ncbi:MAG: hypothetical protein Q9225_002557 [Loekoesia sp. 1 TL-2023]
MSLDLLQEFGNPSDGDLQDPLDAYGSNISQGPRLIDEDEFGDFEQPEVSERPEEPQNHDDRPKAPSTRAEEHQDLLLIDTKSALPPPSPSFQQLNAPLKLEIPTGNSHTSPTDVKPKDDTPITAWPSYGRDRAKSMGKSLPFSPYTDDDEWGDFERELQAPLAVTDEAENPKPVMRDLPKQKAMQSNSILDLMNSIGIYSPPTIESPNRAKALTTEPAAPSNIPPPSVLLSLITSIFQSLSAEIRDIVLSTSTALMNSGSSPNDVVLLSLENKIAMIRGSTRVLAGRKLRWKRDTHLAQNMRIGPANVGKAGGMKLTGVDRTETRREGLEAAEVVRLWKQQVGSIKSHIARINAQQSEIEFVLPEISENTPIRTAKPGEGALTALKCCFLCGLKRDERVARLDVSIEDNFGEWWVDHWGHVDCIRFWEEHKDSLKQR